MYCRIPHVLESRRLITRSTMASLFYLSLALLATSIHCQDDLKKLGEICGNRNPCTPGLDCVMAPVRKRCFPVTCAADAARAAFEEVGFDLHGYGGHMMKKANVSSTSSMFRPFPGDQQIDMIDHNHSDVAKFLQAVRTYPPPFKLVQKHFNSKCARATTQGYSWYYGASWELGACFTYNGDIFWA